MKKNHLIRNIFIIIFITWIIILIKQQLNISKYKDDIQVLTSKIDDAEEALVQNKQDLEEEIQNTNSTDYIEKLAREKLGMYLENERVYVDSNM